MSDIQPQEYVSETIQLREQIEYAFIELGKRFMKIRDEGLYHPQYETFEEFLADARTSPANASKLISVYKTFVIDYGFTEEELMETKNWTSLYAITSHATSKEEAQQLIEEAKHQKRDDFQRTLKERRTGQDMSKCQHSDTYTITICRECGLRMQEHDTE